MLLARSLINVGVFPFPPLENVSLCLSILYISLSFLKWLDDFDLVLDHDNVKKYIILPIFLFILYFIIILILCCYCFPDIFFSPPWILLTELKSWKQRRKKTMKRKTVREKFPSLLILIRTWNMIMNPNSLMMAMKIFQQMKKRQFLICCFRLLGVRNNIVPSKSMVFLELDWTSGG